MSNDTIKYSIYLDGDTLVFTDLTEMINLEMNNNIILGFVDDSYKKAEKFRIKTYKYIIDFKSINFFN